MLSKLPFRHHEAETKPEVKVEKKQAFDDEEGESLTTILRSPEDRTALTLLVADCTEAMRQSLLDVFDPNQVGEGKEEGAALKGDQALLDSKVDPGTVDVAEQDKLKKQLEQRKKEIESQKFQDLKKAALQHFNEWSSSCIQRVGEVVNTRDEPEKEPAAAAEKEEEDVPPEGMVPPMRFPEPSEYDEAVDKTLLNLYPPIETPLKKLPEEQRALILHSMLLLVLSLEKYQAQSRILLLHLTTSLGLSIKFLGHDESKVARGLLTAAENLKADDETKKKASENTTARRWKVGLATVAGAALIGVTGGLAAPLLAAGVGSVMGGLGLGATAAAGYLGTLAGSSVLVGGLFGAYGGRMTGNMMDQYAREVEDFAFIPVRDAHKPRKIEKEFRRLRVGIGISGWLGNQDDIVEPWKVFGVEMESFALRWELEALMNLGNALTTMMKSAAWTIAKREIIQRTIFAALTAGLVWPLGLIKASQIIENPGVLHRTEHKKLEMYSPMPSSTKLKERPVNLVGYSLGAKVIYTCLQRLAERKAFGLIESVVLIGAPSPSTPADWRMMRTVVAGRIVNVYSTNDYLLAFLYRGSSIQYGVAGLSPIETVKGVENVDVTEMVDGHTTYRYLTGPILKKIGFEDVDNEELVKEQHALKVEEEQEAKEREKSEKSEQANVTSGGAVDISQGDVSDQHVKDLEKEVEKKNEQSYIGWAQQQMIGAGTSAATAYEKAKAQWFLRKQGAGGKAAADVAKDADGATGDVSKTTTAAGVDSPRAGDVAYQGMKAKSEARKAGAQPPT